MELILWRHAEAVEPASGHPDLKRCLTARGEKQARHVAQWLLKHQPKHLRILASPAVRCQQTAQALSLPFDTERRIGPAADIADLIAAAEWPGAPRNGAVLLIGHQPVLGRLAALLLSGAESDWNFKKGALWWLSNRMRKTGDRIVLKTVIDPEMI